MTGTIDLPDPFTLLAFDEIDSTNEEAKRQAQAGAPHGTVLWAGLQTAGKGRRNRSWVSPPGNLYLSVLLRPDCTPATATQLAFVAANSVAHTVEALLPEGCDVRCKWPNDVLVAGRKINGILLEQSTRPDGSLDWLVMGMGLNVAHHPDNVEYPATSLLAAGGDADLAVKDVASVLLGALAERLDRWQDLGFAPVRSEWLERAFGLDEPIKVRLQDRTLDGIFDGLDEDGALILRSGDSLSRITAGDVFPAVS